MQKKGKKAADNYAGAIVLGLNDALVELTGVLAGLTLALRSTKLIAVIGFITGVVASLSMAASQYLSSREEKQLHKERRPLKSSIYTGLAYFITVLLLISPYIFMKNVFYALAMTITIAVIIIFVYTYKISVIRDCSFAKRFFEMILISFGVALISFIIGFVLRMYAGIDV